MRRFLPIVALLVVFAGVTILWLGQDRLPPAWDDAWYLANSLRAYDALVERGLKAYVATVSSAFGFKAPLIAALPTPFYFMFGRRWHAAFLVNLSAMALLFFIQWRVARRWWTDRAAVLAVAITGTMPLMYGLARWYLVEYSLAALVALGMALLLDEAFLWFGVVCGFGLLLKAGYVLYVLPAFVYVWWRSERRVQALAMTILPCAVIAAPWYAQHWRPVLANAIDAGYGGGATAQGTGAILSPGAILTYLETVSRSGVSVYYTLLGVVALAWIAYRRVVVKVPRVLLLWILPFAVFLFGGNKDIRYVAPILPAVAIALGGMADAVLPRTRAWTWATTGLLCFAVAQMTAVSFGIPYRAEGLRYARAFDRHSWRHEEIIKLIAANASAGENQVIVGADRAGLNANNLELTAVALRTPLAIETTAHEPDLRALIARVESAAFFIYKLDGAAESTYFNPHLPAVVEHVRRSGRFMEIPYGGRLPDGGRVQIFRRTQTPPPDEFAIVFGGTVALTGVEQRTMTDSVLLHYGWRWLRGDAPGYWSFTHAINAEGKIVAQLDRPIPTARIGQVVGQEIGLAGGDLTGLRLRFGVYLPASGERLRIGTVPHEAARFVLAEDGTSLVGPIGR